MSIVAEIFEGTFSYQKTFFPLHQVDFWKEPSSINQPVDIMIEPSLLEDVKNKLSAAGLTYSVFIDDVQNRIDLERCDNCVEPSVGFDYTKYHTIEEVHIFGVQN